MAQRTRLNGDRGQFWPDPSPRPPQLLDGQSHDLAGGLRASRGAGFKPLARNLLEEGLIPLSASGAFGLHVRPQDVYGFWRKQIHSGRQVDFAKMSEQQRQAFNQDNPYVLSARIHHR